MKRLGGRIGVGMTDLACGGIAAGEQLGLQVLVAGYLGDRDALARRFGLEPSARPSMALLVAHAYRRWGEALSAHLTGEFAAALFDPAERTALLTHDALGLHPIFYRAGEHWIDFADNLVDIVVDPGREALDESYFADTLAIGFVAGEKTPFTGVCRLLPGQSLIRTDRGNSLRQTFTLADVPTLSRKRETDYVEEFLALVGEAVASAVPDAGATWVSLSGGLDSSTIASIAATLGVTGLAAYSHVSEAWAEFDERKWMRAVVDAHSLPWHQQEFSTVAPFSKLPTMAWGEPSAGMVCEGQIEVENALFQEHGVSVVLNGFGGDDVLGCAQGRVPSHLADPLFDARFGAAWRRLRDWQAGARDQRPLSYWLLRGIAEPAVDHLFARRFGRRDKRHAYPPWLRRDYVERLSMAKRARRRLAPKCRHPGRQRMADSLWLQALELGTLPRDQLNYHRRHPLVYRPLVEFMAAVPWELKLRPRCDRYLQRRALKGILPESVRRRASKGSGNPGLVESFRRSSEWIDYLCDDPAVVDRGMVDEAVWRKTIRNASVGQTIDDRFFMSAVTVEGWLKQFSRRSSVAVDGAALAETH